MKLTITPRAGAKKSETNRLRREGFIPSVIYGNGQAPENVAVSSLDFSQAMRHVESGHLPTTVFELQHGDKAVRAIVKDIQYDITTYNVTHLDFQVLGTEKDVVVKVPIKFVGVADCVGVKLGGVLRQVIRHMKVRCKPALIPSHFEIDVRGLSMKQSKRLSAIQFPEGVEPVMNTDEVAVVVVKR